MVSNVTDTSALSSNNAQSSPILWLRGELHNRIYSFAVATLETPVQFRHSPNTIVRSSDYLALVQVCRQVRSEFVQNFKTWSPSTSPSSLSCMASIFIVIGW
ncbi:hypothetical protein EJ02DRAFT_427745 [Clathrospora elynae]|uniref:Uncharacterized protein n=1 Tax=Clathrospora elynae TaxID=706981 RepID=A0A6A5S8S4_9PLEO|nr:hypothetical protein EJ02DRAFT_427745 [Clathrospora elynae]